ncbi:hypothetical protein [Halobaculum gomorrense]|uniref:Uncharacterized protein n=1 Tax=Halobaculum gomorrense TaxID=43928 RepID=A0A1M5MLP5_9EURY|nr:hypothetical protein [Halobaculum gomorrense]SHG78127.1 hypothetical protein SAMN05443636_1055 [Halobaculum gomorrense]
MATLSLGDGSGTGILSGMVTYLSQPNASAARVITSVILGTISAPFLAFANIVQAIGSFFAAPFRGGGEAISALLSALFTAPADLVTASATVTQNALETVLGESLAGFLALPIAVGVVMLSLYFVTLYLREDETGDTIPGLPFDVPTDWLGAEEEATPDE